MISLLIYLTVCGCKFRRTLTQYVSPPPSVLWEAPNISTVKVSVDDQQQSTTIMSFVITERQRLNDWFTALTMEPTELLSEDEIKFSNISGMVKLLDKLPRYMFYLL